MKNLGILIRRDNEKKSNLCYEKIATSSGLNIVYLEEELDEKIFHDRLTSCDGLLITGGSKKGIYDDEMISYAICNQLPLLGICQGMQSMAIYHSDLKIISIGDKHHQKEEGFCHNVLIKPSHLRDVIGKDIISVNTHHLETVLDSNFFQNVAYSDDGLLEAVENSNHPFQIGVQWHPERMVDYDEVSRKLLESFTNSIKENKKAH